ncbi:hypothetical protein BZA77DRAFT_310304 [Pyronema omphalodes]|nr:hypothetical protein BZA77DRAFT_310304 [Pyronema omphalodes]
MEMREYQRINDMYKYQIAKADVRWLRNRKKAVYQDFLNTHYFEYDQWKKIQKLNETEKRPPASEGKTQLCLPPTQETPTHQTPTQNIPTQQTPIQQTPIQQASAPTPRRKTQKRASNKSKHASDSSSSESSPPPKISAPTQPFWKPAAKEQAPSEVQQKPVEPFWKPATEEQRPLEVQQEPAEPSSPAIIISECVDIVYNGLRNKGYGVEESRMAMKYARKGPKDWDLPSVEDCEAWIKAGAVVPKGPDDWMFGEVKAAKEAEPEPVLPKPPARDYGLRGGPLLYEDFEEIWAEEAAEEAARAKAEEVKRAEEHWSQAVEGPRRPVSFEYKRLTDVEAWEYPPTNLLKHSVDFLDVQYSDLTDVERSQGKRKALPRLETLKIIAPREGRRMDDQRIVDDYIFTLREQYQKIRQSKTPEPAYTQPARMMQMEHKSPGVWDNALVISTVTGAVSATAFASVLVIFALCFKYFG